MKTTLSVDDVRYSELLHHLGGGCHDQSSIRGTARVPQHKDNVGSGHAQAREQQRSSHADGESICLRQAPNEEGNTSRPAQKDGPRKDG
jgi:hypothetical protein